MNKIGIFLQYLQKNRFLRFLMTGGVNTLFGFLVYGLAIYAGAEVWLALLIGLVVGIIFNFITTGGYVFRQLGIAYFPRFVFCYLLIYIVNLLLIKGLYFFLRDKILSQLVLIGPIAIFSYYILSKFVFKKNTGK